MATVSMFPAGTTFARVAGALARSGTGMAGASDYAAAQWGPQSPAASILRSAVSSIGLVDGQPIAEYAVAAAEFVNALRPMTILGKLTGLRRAPLRVRIPRMSAGTTVGWVGERQPAVVSAAALDLITLDPLTISGIVVTTQQLADFSNPASESLFRTDLMAAVAALVDQSFIDPANAGESGVSPASVTNGASSIAASGTTAAACKNDLKALFRTVAASINLESPYLVCDKRTCLGLAMFADGDPFFDGVTVNGGMLAGVPLVVSSSLPANTGDSPLSSTIVLLDAASIIVGDQGGAEVDLSKYAAIQMSSTPDSPVTGSTPYLSFFQQGMVGLRVTREINWALRRPGAVAVLQGVSY